MDIHNRIKRRRSELDLTQKQLGLDLGVSPQTIAKWESPEEHGGTAPQRWRLPQVADRLGVTLEWLLSGNSDTVKPAAKMDARYAFIPRYISKHQGGRRVKFHEQIGHLNDEADTYAYRVEWIRKAHLQVQALRVWHPTDASMNMGDEIVLDISKKAVESGLPYVLETPHGVKVRRLYPRFDGQIILRADNPAFPEELAPPHSLDIVGQVVRFSATPA